MSKRKEPPCYPGGGIRTRKHTDSELHGMLQDLLDAGGDWEWITEVNIRVFHTDLCEQQEPPASRKRNLKLVPRSTVH
jgi:hypothetical protein